MEKFIKERIKENEKLFSKEELLNIERNFKIYRKVYIIGCINMKEVYKTK